MQTLELKVEQDHIESLAKVRNPIIAVEELIWNGLDADAEKIFVELVFNNLGGLSKIKISDDGTGNRFDECEQAFGHLGGSRKSQIQLAPGGRVPHGKLGKGRFRAFGIGKTVTWVSRYRSNGAVKQFEIKGQRAFLKNFDVGDEKDVSRKKTGVDVTIGGIETNYPSLTDPARAAEELAKRLAGVEPEMSSKTKAVAASHRIEMAVTEKDLLSSDDNFDLMLELIFIRNNCTFL